MEPFQLVCPGCASRLKVRNRSAIGQRLACPKCREMIQVEAPEGHDIGKSTIGTASFDDMDLDALLENRASVPKPEQQKSKPVRKSESKVSANVPTPQSRTRPETQRKPRSSPSNTAQTGKELQPGENWTNPATKKKQRAVLITMASIGTLLLLGALAMFVFTRPGEKDRPNDVNDVAVVEDGEKSENTKDSEPTENQNVAATENVEPDPVDEADAEMGDSDAFDIETMELPNGISDTPPEIATELNTGNAEPTPEGFGDDTEVASSDKSELKTESPESDESTSVKAILAESGTSILQIQNAASIVRNDFAIGTPRYFFEKVRFDQVNPTKQKDQVLLKVVYNNQSLQTVLHELSSISGLSLTIDAPLIAVAELDFNPKVSIEIENESTGAVIHKVAQSVGLVATETDQGYLLTAKGNAKFEETAISIKPLIKNDNDGVALAEVVRKMVWPGTWEADKDDSDDPAVPVERGSCAFRDGKLEIKHAPAATTEVRMLIDGLKKVGDADAPRESKLLKPVPWIDSDAFIKPFKSVNKVRVPIGQFFRQILDEYDVQIIADWQTLGATGWTSDSMAPGRIDEPTIGDVMRETAHGMEASIYFIDEKTVWITSPFVANNIFLLKIYPLKDIVKGPLSAGRLESVLTESLGAQIGQRGVAFSLLASQQVMVVRAPQTLQRQVAAVLDQLDQ